MHIARVPPWSSRLGMPMQTRWEHLKGSPGVVRVVVCLAQCYELTKRLQKSADLYRSVLTQDARAACRNAHRERVAPSLQPPLEKDLGEEKLCLDFQRVSRTCTRRGGGAIIVARRCE
eukprot:4258075-Amphidinium_carterae.1